MKIMKYIILVLALVGCGSETVAYSDTKSAAGDDCSCVGEVGPQGPAGELGMPGVDAEPGVDGQPGAQGLTGSVGMQGQPGVDGTNGATGATGPQGPIGSQGPQGPKGDQGDQGPMGAGPLDKANVYVNTDTTDLPATSAWTNTFAFCDDTTDIPLNGWCTGPGPTALKLGGGWHVGMAVGQVSGWGCQHQNPTNAVYPVSSHVVCVSVP